MKEGFHGPDRISKTLSPVIKRLNRLIESRFGGKFQYHDSSASLKPFVEKNIIEELKFCREPVKSGNTLYIPVFLQDRLAGTATLTIESELDAAQIGQLHQIVSLAIESTIISADVLERLVRLETHLRGMQGHSNVIPLRDRTVADFDGEPVEEPARPSSFSVPCLIESQSYEDLLKMALEIHSQSGRLAFVRFDQIDEVVTRSSQELGGLGSVTLFIPNICDLDSDQQQALLEFISDAANRQKVQVLAGSTLNYKELIHSNLISNKLLYKISSAYLRMERAYEEYAGTELMEFLFGLAEPRRTLRLL